MDQQKVQLRDSNDLTSSAVTQRGSGLSVPAQSTSRTVQNGDAAIETYIDGEGPALVILPSYGRDSAEDFDDLLTRIVAAGWKVLRPQPRGVADSKGPMDGLTMHDLTNDIASCIRALSEGSAVLLGHAFGHALARMVATDYPDLVKGAILAASQASKVPKEISETPFIVGDTALPESERLDALRRAFFAPKHDARIWLTGWYPETLKMQRAAAQTVPPSEYWACGTVPILEVFGSDDPFKPKAFWDELSSQFGSRVTSVRIEDASHALFPEQPDAIAAVVLSWLARFKEVA